MKVSPARAIGRTAVLAVVVSGVMSDARRPESGSDRRVPIGYTARTFAAEVAHEQRYLARISTGFMDRVHASLTREPHVAGSEGARAVAMQLRAELDKLGLETEVDEYECYLSTVRSVSIEITAPEHRVLTLSEPASSLDPSTSHPGLGPAYVAYSASGTATGEIVYANYGLPSDYQQLKSAGVDVRGKIVLTRYARSHRAVKVYTAEQVGAAGIIIYSDPADDGESRGRVWPEGPWRASDMIQRGNAKYSWFWHGDPLTPGVAARADAARVDVAKAPTLPRIPAVVLSSSQAQVLLSGLAGAPAPASFKGGLPVNYRLGPGPLRVRVAVDMDARIAPVRDVIGRIRGTEIPERTVMFGTHYDAWSFGGVDPQSANAVLLEVARGLSDLRRNGWKPPRTIAFAFWDAEEFGLVGSTEFAERHQAELRKSTVCYINSDMNIEGRFAAGGVPSLRRFVVDAAKDVADGNRSLYDSWCEQSLREARRRSTTARPDDVELAALGSGADFVAFQDFLGLPTLSLEFDFDGSYGAYHSNYDTRLYMERFGDPGFGRAVVLARLLGLAAMRLATSPVLPLRYSDYARKIDEFAVAAAHWAADARMELEVEELRESARKLARESEALERTVDSSLAGGRVPAGARALNDRLCLVEQSLLDESEPPEKHWYRHVVYGWNIYSLYEGQPLPGIADAIRLGDSRRLAAESMRLQKALARAAAAMREARTIAERRSSSD